MGGEVAASLPHLFSSPNLATRTEQGPDGFPETG